MPTKAKTIHTKISEELKKEADVSIVNLIDSIVEHAYTVRGSFAFASWKQNIFLPARKISSPSAFSKIPARKLAGCPI